MIYSIEEHQHRFSSWAASRAASVKGCRFTVAVGKKIIEDAGLAEIAKSIENLPDPDQFDDVHKHWRQAVIQSAGKLNLQFTHGVAAKLINIYLKSIFVCSAYYTDKKVMAIHPPIDRVLLDELYKKDIGKQRLAWRDARKAKWSKLDSEQYGSVISAIKKTVSPNEGLWTIEKHWQGFQ